MSEKIWQKAAQLFVKASGNPLMPVNETLVEFLKILLSEEQVLFISNFRKPILTLDQLKEKTDMNDRDLTEMLNSLLDNGIIMDIPNKTSGIMEYRLLPPIPDIWEYSLVKKGAIVKKRKIMQIYEKLTEEASVLTQKNYEGFLPIFRTQFPPLSRVVPIGEDIGVPQEETLPFYEASKLIDKHDTISISQCPCKLGKNFIGDPCKTTNDGLRCFHFGNVGRFFIDHGFGEPVLKERAKEILKEAEVDGLVHKVFHDELDPHREETALCNCCKCCCIVFQSYYRCVWPFHTVTSHTARLDETKCEGCGICVEKCPIEAISLINGRAYDDENKCIGCGVCVYHYPENARKLDSTGFRKVFIPPLKC